MLTVILIIFTIIIVGTIILVKTILKNIEGAGDSSNSNLSKNETTGQEFLSFADIKNNSIYLGNYRYRAIIELTSINYDLKTEAEKDVIESSYRNFLNGINYSISFFIQTKEFNYGKVLETLRTDIERTKEDVPRLSEYAEIYYEDIKNLKSTLKNSKQKKKYLIVPYEDAGSMTELKPDEKETYSLSELEGRVNMLIDGLPMMGIKGKRLNTGDLIELMYSIYRRDEDISYDSLVNGDYLNDIVVSDKLGEKQDVLQKSISIIQEIESKFKFNVLSERNPEKANELFQAIIRNISEIKAGLIDIETKGGISYLSSDEELFDLLSENENIVDKIDNDYYDSNNFFEGGN